MKLLCQSLLFLSLMSLLCGLIYPMTVTLVGKVVWPQKSAGSLLKNGETIIGSELLAQRFEKLHYFWPRPSAGDYATVPSTASNLGPTSKVLRGKIMERKEKFLHAHGAQLKKVPDDLLTSSASGLDPHISLEAARIQMERVSQARNLTGEKKAKLDSLIASQVEGRQLKILGEPRVNVLLLNRALDETF